MDFFRKRFAIDIEDWKPEALDKRTIRDANASFVKDAVEDVLDGSRPFMIDFVNKQQVTVAQMTVSGAQMYPAPLKETDNWVSFVYAGQIQNNKYFGQYPGRIYGDYRIGNDEKSVGTQHGTYHIDTPNLHRGEVNGVPRNKVQLPRITKILSEKLLDQYSKENPAQTQ